MKLGLKKEEADSQLHRIGQRCSRALPFLGARVVKRFGQLWFLGAVLDDVPAGDCIMKFKDQFVKDVFVCQLIS
jgi:hypothetical protein